MARHRDPDDNTVVVRLPQQMAVDFTKFLRSRGLEVITEMEAPVALEAPNPIGRYWWIKSSDPLVPVVVRSEVRQQAVVLFEEWKAELERPLQSHIKKFRRDAALLFAGALVLGVVLWFLGEEKGTALIHILLVVAGLVILYFTFRSKDTS